MSLHFVSFQSYHPTIQFTTLQFNSLRVVNICHIVVPDIEDMARPVETDNKGELHYIFKYNSFLHMSPTISMLNDGELGMRELERGQRRDRIH